MATPFHFQPLPIPTQSQPSAGNNSFWPTIQQQQTQAASPPSTQPPSSTPAAPPSFAVPSAAPMFPAPTAAPLAAVPSAAPMLPAPHAAGPGSSQALMDALNLLQQNIGALQSLIPLMSQQPPISTTPDQLQQQQAAASVGVASVISQLAVAAANILPQAGLSPPINPAFARCSGFVPSPLLAPDNAGPSNPLSVFAFVGTNPRHVVQQQMQQPQPQPPPQQQSQEPEQQQQPPQQLQPQPQPQSPAAPVVNEPWRPAALTPTEQCAVAAPEPKLFGKPLLPQKRKVEEIAFDAANAEVGPSHASKKLVPAQNAKVPGGVNGCASIADAGLDEENDEESPLPEGTFDIIEMDPVELLAEHTHFCEICGKGFKRDANLRMHMRGHGDAYKTPEALARPGKHSPEATGQPPKRFSCPFVGCKRNQQHRAFVPLKTMLCVKNHYRRTHCPKMLSCSKCGAKRFSVVADLKTHEKHCGRDRWLCSCGTSFSRKDKLLGHLALFKGHRPANPSLTAAAAPTVADAIAAEAAGAAFLEGTDTFSPNYTGAPPPPPSFPSSVVSFSGKGKQLVQKGMDGGAGEVGPAVSSQSTNVDIGKHSGSGGGSNRCSRIDCFSSNLNLNGAALAQCEGDTEEREVEVVLYRQQPCVQLCIGQVIDVQKSEERD
ncbi:unnamed protein product [Closterium sp. NIES-65]|nr:unnamed protein product [Closterium sp. NIES-65]